MLDHFEADDDVEPPTEVERLVQVSLAGQILVDMQSIRVERHAIDPEQVGDATILRRAKPSAAAAPNIEHRAGHRLWKGDPQYLGGTADRVN